MLNTIREVFKEEFAQQKKEHLKNLITENFSITKQQIEVVKKEVLDSKKSIN